MKSLIEKISFLFKKLDEDHIGAYTAECAYFSFLSFIPFIILLLSLLKYVNIETEALASIIEAILPNMMKNSVLDIIQEVYSKSIETISISAIFMLWSAARSFYSLNLAFKSIYKGKREENYILLRIKGMVGTIIAIFVILIVLVLLVFGNKIETILDNNFEDSMNITFFILSIRKILLIIILFIIFLFMYRFTPNIKRN